MITYSVGRKAINKKRDVLLIQELLNRSLSRPHKHLKVDGIAGLLTIRAIERFQKHIGFSNPDGLIEVNGRTWHNLSNYLAKSPAQIRTTATQKNQKEANPSSTYPTRKIAWGNKVSGAFKNKVLQISANLEVSPDYLMACMAFETGGTFSPSVKNSAGSGAIGLIQFMPRTAKALGSNVERLAQMSAIEQLDYVEKYLKPYRNKLKKLEDVYMAILYPAAIGLPLTHILFIEGSKTYAQNKGFDGNDDHKISIKEISAKVQATYERGLTSGYIG